MIFSLLRILPLVGAWGGCYALCRELAARRRMDTDRRMSFLFACALWSALLTGITEASSLFQSLNQTTLLVGWILVNVILWTFAGRQASESGKLSRSVPRVFLSECRLRFSEAALWPMDVRLMLLSVVLNTTYLPSRLKEGSSSAMESLAWFPSLGVPSARTSIKV